MIEIELSAKQTSDLIVPLNYGQRLIPELIEWQETLAGTMTHRFERPWGDKDDFGYVALLPLVMHVMFDNEVDAVHFRLRWMS